MKVNRVNLKKNMKSVFNGLGFIPSTVLKETAGRSIGKKVLNINRRSINTFEEAQREAKQFLSTYKDAYPDLEINLYVMGNKDRVSISSVEIIQRNVDDKINPDNNRQIPIENVVVFPGNVLTYEKMLPSLTEMAKTFDVNVISFNYRGKGNSKGKLTSLSQIVEDGKAQIERLIKNGVEPQNITLYGHCFGGHISTLVAKELHKENKMVYLFNDRSYSNISNLFYYSNMEDITSDVKNGKNSKFVGALNKTAFRVASPTISLVLGATGWNQNAGRAYLDINDEYKDYIVVQNSKQSKENAKNNNISLFEDGMIPDKASLHYFIRNKRKSDKKILKSKLSEIASKLGNAEMKKDELLLKKSNENNSLPELHAKQKELEYELTKYKERKMIGPLALPIGLGLCSPFLASAVVGVAGLATEEIVKSKANQPERNNSIKNEFDKVESKVIESNMSSKNSQQKDENKSNSTVSRVKDNMTMAI